MNSKAKADMTARLTGDVEAFGLIPSAGGSIRGGKEEQNLGPGGQHRAAKFDDVGCRSEERLHWGVPAQGLLESFPSLRRVVPERSPLIRVKREGVDHVGNAGHCGVDTRREKRSNQQMRLFWVAFTRIGLLVNCHAPSARLQVIPLTGMARPGNSVTSGAIRLCEQRVAWAESIENRPSVDQ